MEQVHRSLTSAIKHPQSGLDYSVHWINAIVFVVKVERALCGTATAFLRNLRRDSWCCKIKYSFWPKPYSGFLKIIEGLELFLR